MSKENIVLTADQNGGKPQPGPVDLARVPSGFGIGSSAPFRIHEWCEAQPSNPTEMSSQFVLIPRGMRVCEECYAFYWEAHGNIRKVIELYSAARVRSPWPYFLLNRSGRPVGFGFFDESASIDDLAWISSMFAERALRTAFLPPDDLVRVLPDRAPLQP